MEIRGNVVEHVEGEVHYMRCRYCNSPFMLRGFRLGKPPKSCGCAQRAAHNKQMAKSFKKHRSIDNAKRYESQ